MKINQFVRVYITIALISAFFFAHAQSPADTIAIIAKERDDNKFPISPSVFSSLARRDEGA